MPMPTDRLPCRPPYAPTVFRFVRLPGGRARPLAYNRSPMRAIDLLGLVTLSLLWGSAYLFMRSAVPEFGPVPMIALRMGIAVAVLLPLLIARGGWPSVRRNLGSLAILGIPFTGVPFLMLAFASVGLIAAKVAILQATAPLFAALVGHLWLKERIGPLRMLGLAIGFAGVVVLVWGRFDLSLGGSGVAILAALAASAIWGLSSNFARVRLAGIDPIAMTFGNLGLAGLSMLPLAILWWPERPPSLRAWLEVVFMGVASSGLGFILYFALLQRIGAVRTISVTFLSPLVAMVAGALYLGEMVTMQMLVGSVIILVGTALGLGLVGPRSTATSAPASTRDPSAVKAAPTAAGAAPMPPGSRGR